MKEKSTEISLKKGIELTSNFRHQMTKGDAKAFLIHCSSMVDILKERKILKDNGDGNYSLQNVDGSCLRAYMGVDPEQKEANGQKLVFVGTKKDSKGVYRDMLPNTGNEKSGDGNKGGIYDFTQPCPNECDPGSPLGG